MVSNHSGHPTKRLKLRFPASRERCGTKLQPGTEAWYDPARKKVRCLSCPKHVAGVEGETGAHTPTAKIGRGQTGGSAQSEAERRSARRVARLDAEIAADASWRRRMKDDRPLIGPLVRGLAPKPSLGQEPQHIRA
jgi:hypothetical protein